MDPIYAKPKTPIKLGYVGEEEHRQVIFPLVDGADSANVCVTYGEIFYYVGLTKGTDGWHWVVTSADLGKVSCRKTCQVTYLCGDVEIGKTCKYTIHISSSIDGVIADPPDPVEEWYQTMEQDAAICAAQAAAAEASAEAASASETAAKKSETNAAKSESNAAESEYDARTAKEKALAAAAEAAESADAAQTSMTAAQAAQTAAEEAEETSVTYSKEAVRAASEAGISEGKAAKEQTAAETARTAAQAAQTAAERAATKAATSQTAAASYATAASSSQSAAAASEKNAATSEKNAAASATAAAASAESVEASAEQIATNASNVARISIDSPNLLYPPLLENAAGCTLSNVADESFTVSCTDGTYKRIAASFNNLTAGTDYTVSFTIKSFSGTGLKSRLYIRDADGQQLCYTDALTAAGSVSYTFMATGAEVQALWYFAMEDAASSLVVNVTKPCLAQAELGYIRGGLIARDDMVRAVIDKRIPLTVGNNTSLDFDTLTATGTYTSVNSSSGSPTTSNGVLEVFKSRYYIVQRFTVSASDVSPRRIYLRNVYTQKSPMVWNDWVIYPGTTDLNYSLSSIASRLESAETTVSQLNDDLAVTSRDLGYLWKLNKGISYDFETDSTEAYSKTIPTGAKAVAIQNVGGKSVTWNKYTYDKPFVISTYMVRLRGNRADISLNSDGSVKLTRNNSSSSTSFGTWQYLNTVSSSFLPKDHIYYLHISGTFNNDTVFSGFNIFTGYLVSSTSENVDTIVNTDASTTGKYDIVYKATGDFNVITINAKSSSAPVELSDYVEFQEFGFFNLTKMFGVTDTSSVTDAMKQWCIDYGTLHSEYNAGEIVSADVDYVQIDDTTLPVPSAIREKCPLYGCSAGSVYNEVDYENKKYIQRVAAVDLGTMNWKITGDTSNAITWFLITDIKTPQVQSTEKANILTTYAPTVAYDGINKYNLSIFCGPTAYIGIRNLEFVGKTVDERKAILNGFMLYYELATPIETDITDLLADSGIIEPCECEAGGTVTIHNDNLLETPNTEEYLIALAEVE